ncbi:MAG: hypothetical protein WDN46_08695 [Methylocella sp.]
MTVRLPTCSEATAAKMLAKGSKTSHSILAAVRDHQCGYIPVLQDWLSGQPFMPASLVKPTVVKIFDADDDHAGPAGFDADSLAKLFDIAALVTIIACKCPQAYCDAVRVAKELRLHSVVISTRQSRVNEWVKVVRGRHGDGIRIALWTQIDKGWVQ